MRIHNYTILACLICVSGPAPSMAQDDTRPASIRVLAGIRDYPEEVVEAIVSLSRLPEWLDQAAARVRKGDPIPWDEPDMPEFVRDALQRLAFTPEAVMVTSDHREEAAKLRQVREDPAQSSVRDTQALRDDFAAARSAGAAAWQRSIEREPTSLDAYRDLLTALCKAEQERNPQFACVQVTDRNYYLACPPDGAVMAYAQQFPPQSSLKNTLEDWWRNYGADAVDHRVLTRQMPGRGRADAPSLWNDSPSTRRSMWIADAGVSSGSIGWIPVLLQPAGDQPQEARLAAAGIEHMRLWSKPDPVAPPPPSAPDRRVAVAPPARADSFNVRPASPTPPPPPAPVYQRPRDAQPPPPPARSRPEVRPSDPSRAPMHECLREDAPVVRGYRPRQYERAAVRTEVRVYDRGDTRVILERPAPWVETPAYRYERVIWDEDDLEDWAEDMEDRTGIDDDWWEDRFRPSRRYAPAGVWFEAD